MCENQVYGRTTKIEAIKITNQSEQENNKEIVELLQEQNKLLIEENKSKPTIIEMLVQSQNKLRNDQI